jgi:hypothetical protein
LSAALLELDERALAAYAGRFDAPLNAFDLAVCDGELWMQATPKGGFPDEYSEPIGPVPPPVRIAISTDDMLLALDQPYKHARGEFLRDGSGAIAWMRFGGRVAKREN